MFQSYIDRLSNLSTLRKCLIVAVVYLGLLAVPSLGTPADRSTSAPSRAKVASARIEHQTLVTTEEIPFSTVTRENPQLPKGVTRITRPGTAGERTRSYEVTYTNGVATKSVEIANLITISPVDQVQEVGTGTGFTEPVRRCQDEYTLFGINICRRPPKRD